MDITLSRENNSLKLSEARAKMVEQESLSRVDEQRLTSPHTFAAIFPAPSQQVVFVHDFAPKTSGSVACSGTLSDHLRKLRECCIEVAEKAGVIGSGVGS
ncbi:hypothetical protein ACOSQ4_019700 [Xanthoceras sorbifolium]